MNSAPCSRTWFKSASNAQQQRHLITSWRLLICHYKNQLKYRRKRRLIQRRLLRCSGFRDHSLRLEDGRNLMRLHSRRRSQQLYEEILILMRVRLKCFKNRRRSSKHHPTIQRSSAKVRSLFWTFARWYQNRQKNRMRRLREVPSDLNRWLGWQKWGNQRSFTTI